MLMAGAYSYLPLGLRVLNNIESIIRQEMDACGAAEVLLPALQPLELWQRSGRDKDIGEVMIRIVDRKNRHIVLGPTHEEVITELVRTHVSSYRQLPILLYQIQTKFRDEIRPRFGLIRACEFIMKDAYSFDKDEEGLARNYQAMYDAYQRIFKRCGLQIVTTEADSGVMGGKVSHEFMVPAADGEDIVWVCPQCAFAQGFKEEKSFLCPKCNAASKKENTIEVGHIFKLGTKYSQVLGASFLDAQGAQNPVIMGCYGIGVSRLIPSIIEQNHDADGIIWGYEVAPYPVMVVPLDTTDARIMESAQEVYAALSARGVEVLLDDRDERSGVKFKDADLLGIPLQVTIGRQSLEKGMIELKVRRTRQRRMRPLQEMVQEVFALIEDGKKGEAEE